MDNIRCLVIGFLVLSGASFAPRSINAQDDIVENSVFWEVKGKDLSHPSYLFGTFHLLGAHYIDSLSQVINNFERCNIVAGEILIDSTMTMKMMVAARLNGTSLDKLLGPADYSSTEAWVKELSGYDLSTFNGMNPIAIQIFLMAMLQQKYYPMKMGDEPMDLYFQKRGMAEGKTLIGLETFDIQINALFNQFSLERQVDMLTQFVHEKDKAKDELVLMNKSYRDGNLSKLESLLAEQTYTKREAEVMLDERNHKWMQQLPDLMRQQPTFVAVGALHLAGENGLVALFRKAGYTVTPLSPR
ncbi:MAG TPA: TraB/GumN family protein [Chryseolinea sp.]|nr:TraB/GumN family protein [Chryseolinea sp.]